MVDVTKKSCFLECFIHTEYVDGGDILSLQVFVKPGRQFERDAPRLFLVVNQKYRQILADSGFQDGFHFFGKIIRNFLFFVFLIFSA